MYQLLERVRWVARLTHCLGALLDAPRGVTAASVPVAGTPLAASDIKQLEADFSVARTASSGGSAVRKKPAALSELEVLLAMQNNGWSIRGAALAMGISRQSLYTLLEAHSQLPQPAHIPLPEITDELAKANDDVDVCTAALKTPAAACSICACGNAFKSPNVTGHRVVRHVRSATNSVAQPVFGYFEL
jgi:hypothetical protein